MIRQKEANCTLFSPLFKSIVIFLPNTHQAVQNDANISEKMYYDTNAKYFQNYFMLDFPGFS